MKQRLYYPEQAGNRQPWNDTLFISGFLLYLACGCLDGYFTLRGMQGNLMLEGNPLIRNMMQLTGMEVGLVAAKLFTFLYVLIIAVVGVDAIGNNRPWIYGQSVSTRTTRWLKKKKRIWIAYIPLYVTAVSQLIGAGMWLQLELTFTTG